MDTLDGVDEGSAADKDAGWRHYAKALGPGLITGASDDDPSGIATYAQSGAQFQYGLVWAALAHLAAHVCCARGVRPHRALDGQGPRRADPGEVRALAHAH